MSIKQIISNLIGDEYECSSCTSVKFYYTSSPEETIKADIRITLHRNLSIAKYIIFVEAITNLQQHGFKTITTIENHIISLHISNIMSEYLKKEDENIRIIIVGDYDGSEEQISKIKSLNEQLEGTAKIVTVNEALAMGITDSEDTILINKVKWVEKTVDYINRVKNLKANYPSRKRPGKRIRGSNKVSSSKGQPNNRKKMQKASKKKNRKK